MSLTLVALNGTQRVLNSTEIGNLTSYVAYGGCKSNLGVVNWLGNYTGVPLDTFCNLIGGINSNSSLRVTSSDNYSVALSYEQAKGNFVTFDNVTGQEVPHYQLLAPILAYRMGDANLSSTDGPLELAIVGSEGLVTDSIFWVKKAAKLEILSKGGLVFPSINLQPMNLTIVGLNGTQRVLTSAEIGILPSFEGKGGYKTSAGSLRGIGNYTGVTLVSLCNLVGGITDACGLRVTASDGYSMVYTYDQVMGQGLVTFDPATGDETNHTQPLTTVLAYYKDGLNLTSDEGPLRLAILGSEGVLTEGHWWIKYVMKIEIRSNIVEWALMLRGALVENMSRATFESGVNEHCHGLNWTDSNNNVWTGIPLWLLVGRVDDGDVHETNSSIRAFNDTLALQGYTVKVLSGQGYSREFNSTTVMRNANIIVANRLNGAPLPEPYWPLRLVGSGLSSSEMLSNVVEIQIVFPGS
jgi:hypothetical protein